MANIRLVVVERIGIVYKLRFDSISIACHWHRRELSKSYQLNDWPVVLAFSVFSLCLHTGSSTCQRGQSPIQTSMTPRRMLVAPQDPDIGGCCVWPGRRSLPDASSWGIFWGGRRISRCPKSCADRCDWINRLNGRAISITRARQIDGKCIGQQKS